MLGVFQGGVGASSSHVNDYTIVQCGGGGCPTATATGTACNPYNWYYYDSAYKVEIVNVDPDRTMYRPGETVEVSGTVRLLRQDSYVNECGEVGTVDPVTADPSHVAVQLAGPFGAKSVGVSSSGSFGTDLIVPDDAESGPITYTVTASYSSSADEKEISFEIETFSPSLQVAPSHTSWFGTPGNVLPGDTVTVSGSGWAPGKDVTLTCSALGLSQTVPVDESGAFTVDIAIPEGQAEGPYVIKGNEPPNLETSAPPFNVAWRTLTLTLDTPAPTQLGSTATISGTVTDGDGKTVEGASVTFEPVNGLPAVPGASADASGKFTTAITVPEEAPVQSYTIQGTAKKTPGYKPGSGSATLQVTQRPILSRIGRWLGQNAGSIASTLASIAVAIAAIAAIIGTIISVLGGGSESAAAVAVAVAASSAIRGLLRAAVAEGASRSWIWHMLATIGVDVGLIPHIFVELFPGASPAGVEGEVAVPDSYADHPEWPPLPESATDPLSERGYSHRDEYWTGSRWRKRRSGYYADRVND